MPVAPRSLLARDHKHFKLGLHTDAPAKIVTGVFYLPRTSEMQEFGTAFFRPTDPTYKSWRTVHHEFDGFEPVKVCPYLPNTMAGFVKTDSSFHGVLHRDYPDRTRDLLFYLPEIGVRADNPVTLELPIELFGAPRTISAQASPP